MVVAIAFEVGLRGSELEVEGFERRPLLRVGLARCPTIGPTRTRARMLATITNPSRSNLLRSASATSARGPSQS